MAVRLPGHAAVQGGWLPPAVRATLLSLRPWSFTLSVLSVVAAACAASWEDSASASFGRVAVVVTGVVGLHGAANLINTLRDFARGVDQPSSADDRTLVDGLVPASTLSFMAWLFAATGTAALGGFAAAQAGAVDHWLLNPPQSANQDGVEGQAPWEVTSAIVGAGLALGVLYSAGPCGLKYNAAGEVAVFAAFGPLLGAGTSQALLGRVVPSSVLAAAPFGVFAVAVLHANNVRDVKADRKAGARTLAQSLPPSANRFLFRLLVALGLASAAAAVLEVSTPAGFGGLGSLRTAWARSGSSMPPLPPARAAPGLLLLLACVPWALALARRFDARRLATLPQQTAQLASLAGGALLAGLVAPSTAGRGLLAVLFGLGGINNVVMWGHTASLVAAKLRAATGLPLPGWLCRAAALLSYAGQTAASVTLTLGVRPCASAWVLLLFLVAVTPAVHDMWSYSGEDEEGEAAGGGGGGGGGVQGPGGGGDGVETEAEGQPEAEQGEEEEAEEEEVVVSSRDPVRSSSAPRRRRRSGAPAEAVRAVRQAAPAGRAHSGAAAADPCANALPAGGGGVPTFLDPFSSEFVHFFKNVGMAGGLLVFLTTAGECGLGR